MTPKWLCVAPAAEITATLSRMRRRLHVDIGDWRRSVPAIRSAMTWNEHRWMRRHVSGHLPLPPKKLLTNKKVKVAHTRLPSVWLRSWSRFLAVSLQVMWVINPAVGCHYFPPGLQLPVTPATLKRAATSFAAWWTEAQLVWTVCLRLLPDTAIWTRALLPLSPARYPLGYRATYPIQP